MTKTLLPLAISVPHGGTKVPKYLRKYCNLKTNDILLDGDTWTKEIFALADEVDFYIDTDVARAVIDMNRSVEDLPPANPDGVLKTVTVQGVKIWRKSEVLPVEVVERLIRAYHVPYHQKIENFCRQKKAVLGIDCHTMLSVAPPLSPLFGQDRPLICLSNNGDDKGMAIDGAPTTAPADLLLALKSALIKEFEGGVFDVGNLAEKVKINHPFKGGYITRHHGFMGHIPWIQVELNKSLYLKPGVAVTVKPKYNELKKLKALKEKFTNALRQIL